MKQIIEGHRIGVQWRGRVNAVVIGLSGLVMSVGFALPSVGMPHQSIAIKSSRDKEQPASAPRSQPIFQLRHGPYFPSLDVLAPPLPDPVLPTVVQPITLVIRLSERRVYVYQGDEVQTSYPIAVGKDGWETPTGRYEVMSMQENPAWQSPFTGAVIPPGRNNPLGDRWIGFWSDGNNVIGFHGTPNEGSVGRAASHGCIRMFNRDVRELYAIAEVGMSVIVEP